MHMWCRLIEHAQTTLNLLWPSRINPLISADAVLNGPFDYNKTPLAPPGTKVVVYETPEVRGTWSPHGVDGWYIGSARKHYRCHRVYITKTRTERIARTVQLFPYQTTIPTTLSADMATKAAIQLTEVLLHPTPASSFAVVPNQLEVLHAHTTATRPCIDSPSEPATVATCTPTGWTIEGAR